MKTRIGFVSNSSSSSYIIAEKLGERCQHCGRKDPDFIGILNDRIYGESDDTRTIAEGLDVITYIANHEYLLDDSTNEETETQGMIKQYLSNGWKVAYVEISYHDKTVRELFREAVDGKTIKILKSFE